jgi:hypothetical protein
MRMRGAAAIVLARPALERGSTKAGLGQDHEGPRRGVGLARSRFQGADHLAELADRGPTVGALGEEWLDGVARGRIGRGRGKGRPYSDTTIASMRRRRRSKVRAEFGDRFAGELTEMDWQRWIDQLAHQGLSRSCRAPGRIGVRGRVRERR